MYNGWPVRGRNPLLIRSIFVDVPLELFVHTGDMVSLTFIALKNLQKRAFRRTLGILTANVSYELRQLALSACHKIIKRWSMLISNFAM